MGGAKPRGPKGVPGQINPDTGLVEVENVVHVEDREKMKEMEEQLEKEKEKK